MKFRLAFACNQQKKVAYEVEEGLGFQIGINTSKK